jgi:hypothetical protein
VPVVKVAVETYAWPVALQRNACAFSTKNSGSGAYSAVQFQLCSRGIIGADANIL